MLSLLKYQISAPFSWVCTWCEKIQIHVEGIKWRNIHLTESRGPKFLNMTEKFTPTNINIRKWPKKILKQQRTLTCNFRSIFFWSCSKVLVSVNFQPCSKVKVRRCKYFLVIIWPKFGHLDSVMWTSLIKWTS